MNSCTTCVTTSPQIRVALYLRVSTKDKGQETANQANQLREFCKSQGWMIVFEYEDHDSGGKTDRARFQAMMADAAQRRFDVLVFWALDRLTREAALETLQHPNRISSYGVGLRSFTEPASRPPDDAPNAAITNRLDGASSPCSSLPSPASVLTSLTLAGIG